MTRLFRTSSSALGALALVLAGAGVVGASLTPTTAVAQARNAQAEGFVGTQSQRALAILGNRALSQPQKAQQFRAFIDQVANVPSITEFVLGKYNRTITPAQRQQFAQVFRVYATSMYESRLDEYKGERFTVTGSQPVRGRTDDVVVTSIVSGGQLNQPRTVRWRVKRDNRQQWRVVDVEVAGVWLAITQQQDFVATVDNAGGNINVLINRLRTQSARAGR